MLSSAGSSARDVTHELLIRNWPQLTTWVEEDKRVQQNMATAIAEGRVGGWVQARALEPVLGWPRSPIFPERWVEGVAQAVGKGGFSRARLRWLKLKASYKWVRWRTTILSGSALAVALMGFGAWYWFVHLNAESRLNALQAQVMEAHAVATNLTSSQSKRQSIRQRAAELLAAANIWQQVTGELAKLDASAELNGQVGDELRLAERAIDEVARELLGKTFTIRQVGKQDVGVAAHCEPEAFSATSIDQSSPSPAEHKRLRVGTLDRAVELDVATGSLKMLAAQPNGQLGQAHVLLGALPGSLSPASQVCLSQDGGVLTVSQPAETLPTIISLAWHKGTDQNSGPSVSPTVIEAPAYIPEIIDTARSSNNVRQPTVLRISALDAKTGERDIEFSLGASDARFIASYYEGYAAPMPVIDSLADGEKCPRPTDRKMVAAAVPIPDPSCELRLGHLTLRSQAINVGSSDDPSYLNFNVVRAYVGGVDRNDLPRTVIGLYGPPFDRASVRPTEQGGILYLHDVANETWMLRMFTDEGSIEAPLRRVAEERIGLDTWSWSDVCRVEGCDHKYQPTGRYDHGDRSPVQ